MAKLYILTLTLTSRLDIWEDHVRDDERPTV
jgi:hypothetical protein